MRAMFMVVASVLLAAGLFGCNRTVQAPVAAPVVAVTPPPSVVLPAAPAAPEILPRPHHRHTAWRAHESASYASYSESESESGSSDYSREYAPQDRSDSYGGSESDSDAAAYPPPPPPPQAAWVDGYGREHYGSADPSQDENPDTPNREESHARRSPWHGWNSDCDERRD